MKQPARHSSLFDIQVNGFAGVDFQKPDLSSKELLRAVQALASHQTAHFFVTLITDGLDALAHKFRNLESLRAGNPEIHSAVCGYHLEGPWLSPEPGFRGAHSLRHLRNPDRNSFAALQTAAGGNIRLVTLAPELDGGMELIKYLSGSGVAVSIGHSNASDQQITSAIAAGARFCTHLGNGVPLQLHRHDNVVQRLLARDELTAFFIPDGVHLPPPVLKNFFRAKPDGKALFTTDCMAAAGSPPGRYTLGELTVEMEADRIIYAPSSRQFAGSSLCPDEGVRHLEEWLGLDGEQARRLFSTAAADLFNVKLPEIS